LKTRFSLRQKQTTNKQTNKQDKQRLSSFLAPSRLLQAICKRRQSNSFKGRPASKREEERSYTYDFGLERTLSLRPFKNPHII
jgi:hypothetical protein